MDELELLIDLHREGERQGPGSAETTTMALSLAGVSASAPLAVADIGCGTGAASLQLAKALNAEITAIDFLPAFLEILEARARDAAVDHQITTLCASMDSLPLEPDSLDLIWSEGAIYNMGFAEGISAWRPFLKADGVMVVSEITWTTHSRPAALDQHWRSQYAQIDLASAKVAAMERAGFKMLGYFMLPEDCWSVNYYAPMADRFDAFLERHQHSDTAKAIVAAERKEITLYERYKQHYSYGMYIARRTDGDGE